MRPLTILGAVLIVAGIAALAVPYIVVTDTKKVIDAGPLQVETKQDRTIPIPAIAGVVAVVAGLGCVFMARRGT
jgi:hypothetical protein